MPLEDATDDTPAIATERAAAAQRLLFRVGDAERYVGCQCDESYSSSSRTPGDGRESKASISNPEGGDGEAKLENRGV